MFSDTFPMPPAARPAPLLRPLQTSTRSSALAGAANPRGLAVPAAAGAATRPPAPCSSRQARVEPREMTRSEGLERDTQTSSAVTAAGAALTAKAKIGAASQSGADRRFVLHEIADDRGRVQARDLQLRRDGSTPSPELASPADDARQALANALLEGYVASSLPAGRLFITLDADGLRSSVAEAVTEGIGAILLSPDLPVSTAVLMRVAQLRSAGVRFSIDGISSLQDPRWLFAPYADSMRLDLQSVAPDQVDALISQADEQALEVIGSGVRSMAGYQRLADLAVTQLQGPFIASPLELVVPALPGCDDTALLRTQRLLANRVSFEAVAVAAAADPALVMRLQILHRLYGAGRHTDPVSLAALLQSFPAGVLAAWLDILRRTACHDHHTHWTQAVRDQVEVYRRSLHRRCEPDEELQASVWLFLKRLSSPVHYLKTLRHPD